MKSDWTHKARVDALLDAYWSECWEALPMIIEALGDADGEVVNQAVWALEHYPGVATALALRNADWRRHYTRDDDPLETALENLKERWSEAVGTPAEAHIRQWLEPIADLVDLSHQQPRPRTENKASVLTVTQQHLEQCQRWIADHGGVGGVLRLMHDESNEDHDMAVYCAVHLPKDPQIARAAFQVLQRDEVANSQRREAFATWLAHTEPDQAIGRIRNLREHENLAVRCAALHELGSMGQLQDIAPTWTPRPGDSVAEVVSWLDACTASGWVVQPPKATWLMDSAWVKRSLIRGMVDGNWGAPER